MSTEDALTSDPQVVERDEPLDTDVPWLRLSGRMIVVDLVVSLLSVAPSLVAFVLLGVPVTWGTGGPLLVLAVVGVGGAAVDAVRWVTTRYRLTDDHLERSTGLLVRRYRSIRRERVRSVDTDAKLRHRLAGLRVVLVGAGQQSAASESALALDAIASGDAERLRDALLRSGPTTPAPGSVVQGATEPGAGGGERRDVHATFRWWWVIYNVVGIWAFLMAAGLLWGGWWFLSALGVDVAGLSGGLLDLDSRSLLANVVVLTVLLAVVGALGMAVNYAAVYGRFELARVPGEESTSLRTRHGLLRTREVNRDDRRLRGVMVSEPVLWRWMGMADTEVVTTGLSIWSTSTPSTILPRGPIGVARSVATRVLDAEPDPMAATLRVHPARALRRRLVWAASGTAVVVALLAYAAAVGPLPWWVVGASAGLLPVALLAALIAYRALGNAVAGAYVVVRSGFVSRRTVALQRSAVSTVVLRESILQRRLGLRTVTVATAAGWGGYAAPDLAADESVTFALEAAPGLLDAFVERT